MALYIPLVLSFISTQFSALNLDGWFGILSKKFITFWYSIIMLLYQSYIIKNFQSFSGDLYFSLCMYLSSPMFSSSFVTVSKLFCGDFCNFIYNVISSKITSYFSCFLNCSFWSSVKWIFTDFLAWSRRFWLYLKLKLLLTFLPIFISIFLAKDNNP